MAVAERRGTTSEMTCPPWCVTGASHLAQWVINGAHYEHRSATLLCPTAHTDLGNMLGLPITVVQRVDESGQGRGPMLVDVNGIQLTRAQAVLMANQLLRLTDLAAPCPQPVATPTTTEANPD